MASYTNTPLLTRKVAVGGELGFLDACLDAINDEYRKSVLGKIVTFTLTFS